MPRVGMWYAAGTPEQSLTPRNVEWRVHRVVSDESDVKGSVTVESPDGQKFPVPATLIDQMVAAAAPRSSVECHLVSVDTRHSVVVTGSEGNILEREFSRREDAVDFAMRQIGARGGMIKAADGQFPHMAVVGEENFLGLRRDFPGVGHDKPGKAGIR